MPRSGPSENLPNPCTSRVDEICEELRIQDSWVLMHVDHLSSSNSGRRTTRSCSFGSVREMIATTTSNLARLWGRWGACKVVGGL